MDFMEWVASVDGLLRAAPIKPGPSAALRSRLVALAEAVKNAPDKVNTLFIHLDEEHLSTLAGWYWDDLSSGQIRWDYVVVPTKEAEFVMHVAAVIRAIDEYLLETGSKGPPHFPGLMDAEGSHWVIPRKWPRPSESLAKNQSFRRRGLRFHRIIPTTLSGNRVEPRFLRMMSVDAPPRRSKDVHETRPTAKLSANVFDSPRVEFAFEGHGSEKRFIATAVTVLGHDAVIKAQVEQGLAQGATIMLWPELTMPPAQRETAIAVLRDTMFDIRQSPQVVVLGSWHEQNNGAVTNTTVVVNGYGQEQARYSKMVPFQNGDVGTEAITPGEELVVLVADDFVATVAICKDFCELPRAQMFVDLDVDLFLVPSMSNQTTMGSHTAMAKLLRVGTGGYAFVVQQPDDPSDKAMQGVWALVLPAPRDPEDENAVRAQSVSVHLYESACI